MVAWFAGLFYIFRLFVYHAKHWSETAVVNALVVMESKLIRIIMYPAMCVTVLCGSMLLYLQPIWLKQSWIHIKLTAIVGLVAYHFLADFTHRQFKKRHLVFTERHCRILNEIPTIFLLLIISLAVFKPQ